MFTKAIVCSPASNFAGGLTTVELGVPDFKLALEQHEAYCVALEKCGLDLIRLPPDERFPDSTFVEDVAILTEALPHGRATAPARGKNRCAILTRPGAPSRSGEVESMRRVLAEFFPSPLFIQGPGTLDGGDICEAGNHFFIGISERTNEAGGKQLAEILAHFDYTCSFVDIRGVKGILHLKSGIAYLGDGRLAILGSLADRSEFRSFDLVRVNPGDEYAANCVRINDRVLIASGYPGFEASLTERGYQTIALEMSEFQKMDGGLSCLSLRF